VTGPAPRLRLVPGDITDQVVRLEEFRAAHPDVTVVYVRPGTIGGYWLADWTDPDGADCRTVQLSLKGLLDKLGAP
jgi:hypothetical protein